MGRRWEEPARDGSALPVGTGHRVLSSPWEPGVKPGKSGSCLPRGPGAPSGACRTVDGSMQAWMSAAPASPWCWASADAVPAQREPKPQEGTRRGAGRSPHPRYPEGSCAGSVGPADFWGTPARLRTRENGSDSYRGLSHRLDAARCPQDQSPRTAWGPRGEAPAWRGHRRQGIQAPWDLRGRGRPARRCHRRPGGRGLWREDTRPFAQSRDPFAAAGRSGLKVPAGPGQRWRHRGWAVRPLVPAGRSGSSGQRGTQIPPPGAAARPELRAPQASLSAAPPGRRSGPAWAGSALGGLQ